MENTLEKVGERRLSYFRQRQRNRVFTAVVAFVAEEVKKLGLTRRDVANALDRDPAQITRWLTKPSNMTLDSISDLLAALGAEMDVRVVKIEDRATPNYQHELFSKIKHRHQDSFATLLGSPISEKQKLQLKMATKQSGTNSVLSPDFEDA